MPGLLVLNGGDEFRPGNEPQDRLLVEAAASRPALILATAAARSRPEQAVATAKGWFGGLGLQVGELPVLNRTDAQSPALAERAAAAGLLYLAGGDPGLVARVLLGSRVWAAISAAWRGGAALAGSSAGAMALCEFTLVMARWPGHSRRRPVPALGLVPGTVVVPHYERYGGRWEMDLPPGTAVIGIDERTAAVWSGGGWRALGAGAVTLIRDGARSTFAAGEPCPGLPSPAPAGP